MADTIDLTGGGGVLKTVIWKAKADADSRSESLPLVEGIALYLGTLLQSNITGLVLSNSFLCNLSQQVLSEILVQLLDKSSLQ
jgi:hypothetical protein